MGFLFTLSTVISGLKPKKEWMVWPDIFTALTPVGAKTTMFLRVMERKYSRRVDFPARSPGNEEILVGLLHNMQSLGKAGIYLDSFEH